MRRRRRGFERVGAAGTRELPLPPPRARDLLIAEAWQRAAGPALAARARALLVVRGGHADEAPERRWADALRVQLLELASRTAALAPDLHIRKLRVRLPDGTEATPPSPFGDAPAPVKEPDGLPRKAAAGGRGGGPAPGELTREALAELRDRYLATSERKRRGRA